jgi:triosephosphate isomerase
MSRRLFIAGNWKMNKSTTEAEALASELKKILIDETAVDIAVAPTSLSLSAVCSKLKHTNIHVAAQNMHSNLSGAFTGEISGEMLRAAGAEYVLIGHSERRHVFGESQQLIQKKMTAAFRSGLLPILCVGETLGERDSGNAAKATLAQVSSAMANLSPDQAVSVTIAYEPVWAIGTGRTASPAQAQEMHAVIRKWLSENFPSFVAKQTRIQYGGSVKPNNAAVLMSQPDVDGALVGGASLNAESFALIVKAAIEVQKG